MRKWWVLCGLLVAASAAAEPAYKVMQDVPLAGGRLQILEDARLDAALEKQLWDLCVDPVDVLGDDDPAAKPFRDHPLVPAKLRQLDANGAIVLDTDLAPIARIERQTLGRPPATVVLVRTDDTACAGSYTGQSVTFYGLTDGRLTPALAVDSKGNTSGVTVMESLKSGWRFVRKSPGNIVIDQLLCRPDFEAEKHDPKHETHFELLFITYRYDGRHWRFAEHARPGYWESEEDFPAHTRFPKVE